ncbi:hypothetical protein ACFQU0_07700 [Hydrogenophaga defluvii]|uniref:Uncharacterized protein n=1 Tax=Hydrogenophaga defluvii TaxID=249410 RepID=A0ABW2SA61_9BURK
MDAFKSHFLDSYLANGLGSLSKRDIEVLLIYLLDEYGLVDGKPLKALSNQSVSILLKAPNSRIKALRYEATLKYTPNNEDLAKSRLLEVIAKSQLDSDKRRIGLIIEDSFTRNWLQGHMKDHGLVFDGSFNSEVVRADADQICNVLLSIYDEQSVNTFREKIAQLRQSESKLSFPDVKKDFLKGAIGGLGKAAVGITVKGLVSLAGG